MRNADLLHPTVFQNPKSAIRNPKLFLVHVVGLAPTKDNQVRLISEEGAFAAEPHMHDQISNFKFNIPDDFKSEGSLGGTGHFIG